MDEITLTGWRVADILNEKLTKRGIKNIPPQMIYQYISKGYIKSVVVGQKNGKDVRRVTIEEAHRYIKSYLNGEKNVTVSKAQLMSHFEDL